jgi:hypothetical protein
MRDRGSLLWHLCVAGGRDPLYAALSSEYSESRPLLEEWEVARDHSTDSPMSR